MGLLDPGMPAAELDGYVGRQVAREAQRRANPEGFTAPTEEKAVVYRHRAAVGLPTGRRDGQWEREHRRPRRTLTWAGGSPPGVRGGLALPASA